MRPPAKWNKGPKDPKERRRRKPRSRSERGLSRKKNGNDLSNAKSDSGTPNSDASSPNGTATEAADAEPEDNGEIDEADDEYGDNGETGEPELPPMPMRSNSAEPPTSTQAAGLSAAIKGRGVQRAVQSSPIRPVGSHGEPIELDLIPPPLRRQLFSPPKPNSAKSHTTTSSGDSSRPLASLPNFVRRSPRLNKTREALEVAATISISHDKENVTPGRSLADGLDDLFGDANDDYQLPPMTPTPSRRSDRIIFKTPSKRTPGAELSPNIRRSLQKSVRHPAMAALLGSNKLVAEMTPFSKQIHQLLSDAATHQARSSPAQPPRRSPRRHTPQQPGEIDFPDLPSLHNSSPMSQQRQIQFDFSELTTEQMQESEYPEPFSTDAPMPSSPPPGLFDFANLQDDSIMHGSGMVDIWADMDFGHEEPLPSDGDLYPDPTGLQVGATVTTEQGLRRSPRKAMNAR